MQNDPADQSRRPPAALEELTARLTPGATSAPPTADGLVGGLLAPFDRIEFEAQQVKARSLRRMRVDLKRMELERQRLVVDCQTNPFKMFLSRKASLDDIALDERILDYIALHDLDMGDGDWRLPALLHAARNLHSFRPKTKRGRKPRDERSLGLLDLSPVERANLELDEFEKHQAVRKASGKEHSQNATIRGLVSQEMGQEWNEDNIEHQNAFRRSKDRLHELRKITGRNLKAGRTPSPKE